LLAFAAEAGAFAALGGQHVGVAGVGIAPAQVRLQPPGQRGVVRVVRVAHDKGPQGTEMRLDRIGPRRVRGREAQFDVLPLSPAADRRGLVRGQVVHDHEQAVASAPGGPDRLERGQGVIRAFVLADHAPQLVIAEGVAAVEVPDAVGAVIGRAQPDRVFARRPASAVARPDRQRPELIKGKAPVRVMAGHVLDPVQLGVPVRITGLLPGPGPLEGDAAGRAGSAAAAPAR
jgi:hypothetical protein